MRDVPGQHHCNAASKTQCMRTSFWESGAASHNRKKLSSFNFESGKRDSELLPSRTLCPKNPKGVIGKFATCSAKVRHAARAAAVSPRSEHPSQLPHQDAIAMDSSRQSGWMVGPISPGSTAVKVIVCSCRRSCYGTYTVQCGSVVTTSTATTIDTDI